MDSEKRAYYLANSRCACCGKALKDGISIKYGIGPECRKIHGFEDSQKEADWRKLKPLATLFFRQAEICDIVGVDLKAAVAKQKANDIVKVLLRFVAVFGDNSEKFNECVKAIEGIAAAGWDTLAKRMVKRYAQVRISEGTNEFVADGKTIKYDTFEVETPFSYEFVGAMKSMKARFQKVGRRAYWQVNAKKKAELWDVLKSCYSGCVATSDKKALFVI